MKNYNTTDGGDNSIKLTVAWDPVPLPSAPEWLQCRMVFGHGGLLFRLVAMLVG